MQAIFETQRARRVGGGGMERVRQGAEAFPWSVFCSSGFRVAEAESSV